MAKVTTDFIVRDSKISILLILRLFALTYFILQLVLLWHTGGNVFKLVLALFACLLLFSLFKEWQFSPTKKALHIFTGLSLLERGLYTSSFKAFPYAQIKQLAVKPWQQSTSIDFNTDDGDTYWISTLSQAEKLHRQLTKASLATDLEPRSVQDPEPPREELLAALSARIATPDFQTSFNTSTWWLPVPGAHRLKVFSPIFLSILLAIFTGFSASNYAAAAVLVITGASVSLVLRKLTNQTFYNPKSLPLKIRVSCEQITLPGIYFEHSRQQIINKADIASIVLTWHWYSRYWKHCTPSKNASIRALEIQLTNGQYISISTVNCPPLMVSLFRQGYAIVVQQIDNPWRKWFVPGGVIFVLMLTVVIAQGIYQADYFPLHQS